MNFYLISVKKWFEHYKGLCEKTITLLTDDQLFWCYNSESNSIALIIQHLSGNMLSRWTDFLDTDGEKAWRNRNAEFEQQTKSRQQLLFDWNAGWDRLFQTLNLLNESDFLTKVRIRNESHSVIDAINRQLAHYAYHAGQIVFIGKMALNENWISLSIPKTQ